MKKASELITTNLNSNERLNESNKQSQATFSQESRDKTSWFFSRLLTIFGKAKIEAYWPTDAEKNAVKREFCNDIDQYSRVDLNTGLEYVKNHTDPDWPDIRRILQLCDEVKPKAYHKVFEYLPAPVKTQSQKDRDIEEGKEQIAAMKNIMAGL